MPRGILIASPLRKPLGSSVRKTKNLAAAAESAITEVPLVFDMTTSAWSPLQSATVEVAVAVISTFLAIRFLDFLTRRYAETAWAADLAPDSRIKKQKTLTSALLRVITGPLRTILPIYCGLHCVRVLTCRMTETMNLCSTCARRSFERRMESVLDFFLRFLTPIDRFVHTIITQALIFVAAWFLVTAKNQYVAWKIEEIARRNPAQVQDFKRIILPLNDISSWVIVAVSILVAFGMTGIDIRPIVTIGGAGGIVIGLAAQSVLSNMIAGINLFLSRPFVRGDRVQVFSAHGVLIYNGIVERVNPLRTVIRTDKNYPLTVPNKLLADLVIANESRFPTSPVLQLEGSRRIQVALKLGLDYFDKLDEVNAAVTHVLQESEGINRGLPFGVTIGELSDADVTLEIQATALKRESSKFGELRLALMRQLRTALREHGIEEYKLSF